MVDFNMMLKDSKIKGRILGYCNKCDNRICEVDFLLHQESIPVLEKRVKCPNCGLYQLESNLIPF